MLNIRLAAENETDRVHGLMLEGFADYRCWPLPSSALLESSEDVARAVRRGGALLASWQDVDVGSARFEVRGCDLSQWDLARRIRTAAAGPAEPLHGATLLFSRMAVLPAYRSRGVGRAMVAWLEALSRNLGIARVEITVRSQQPDNRAYYLSLGYQLDGYSERYGISDMVSYMHKSLEIAGVTRAT